MIYRDMMGYVGMLHSAVDISLRNLRSWPFLTHRCEPLNSRVWTLPPAATQPKHARTCLSICTSFARFTHSLGNNMTLHVSKQWQKVTEPMSLQLNSLQKISERISQQSSASQLQDCRGNTVNLSQGSLKILFSILVPLSGLDITELPIH